jgi:hypothetical protein
MRVLLVYLAASLALYHTSGGAASSGLPFDAAILHALNSQS